MKKAQYVRICYLTLYFKNQPIQCTPSITYLPPRTTSALTPATFYISEDQHRTRTYGTQDSRKLKKYHINSNYCSNTKHYSKFKPCITPVLLQIHITTNNNQLAILALRQYTSKKKTDTTYEYKNKPHPNCVGKSLTAAGTNARIWYQRTHSVEPALPVPIY
jgi:hypothetical protein